ncbi:TRAP transporter small permease [Halobacillus salinarum]|uniref:TRAP transporter small permease n=1 Tax=Halobacillus salinarum TaxID=2932257 RepID=A0ABY4EI70_9BACI|nr:TRAP transporter small permease [Halobacillus salinarum]UOQ44170.1 TRAP transporter small permease [Halobacillus salinarum]
MEWLKKWDRGQTLVEKWIISWSIIGMTVVLLANVIARSFLGNSLTYAEEVGQFFLILVTFVGLSYCARNGRHLKMTAFVEMLPFRFRKYLVIFTTFSTSGLLFFLTYYGVRYTWFLYDVERVTPALRFPLYLIMLFVPLGLFFGAVQYAYEGYLNIRYANRMIDGTLAIFPEEKEGN